MTRSRQLHLACRILAVFRAEGRVFDSLFCPGVVHWVVTLHIESMSAGVKSGTVRYVEKEAVVASCGPMDGRGALRPPARATEPHAHSTDNGCGWRYNGIANM
jgi:hypothetical protein